MRMKLHMKFDKLLQGMAILLGLQYLSVWLLNLAGVSFPAPLLGMLLLFVLLQLGIVKESFIDDAANLLLSKMGLLFLPPAVGIVMYLDAIRTELVPILTTVFGGSIIILICTAHFTQLIAAKGGNKQDGK